MTQHSEDQPRVWMRPEDLIGLVLDGRYVLRAVLGSGGMGAVYEAEQIKLHKRFAIKVLSPSLCGNDTHRKRFLREAQAASRIVHKNVIEIMDFGEVPGGSVYFVMKYLEGHDLAHLIAEQGRLHWSRARIILLQIVDALAAAHAKGIIHRDVKPANFFLVREHQEDVVDFVKMLDFGIAKVTDSTPETRGLTATAEVMGTIQYMAPEQAQGATLDHRTDIYSLGVMAYEMIAGRVPFTGPNAFTVMTKHVTEEPEPLRSVDPSIAEDVENVVLRCLRKDPGQRWQTMRELREAILSCESSGKFVFGFEGGVASSGDIPPTVNLADIASSEQSTPERTEALPSPIKEASSVPVMSPEDFVMTNSEPPISLTRGSSSFADTAPIDDYLIGRAVRSEHGERRRRGMLVGALFLVVVFGAIGVGLWIAGGIETGDSKERQFSSVHVSEPSSGKSVGAEIPVEALGPEPRDSSPRIGKPGSEAVEGASKPVELDEMAVEPEGEKPARDEHAEVERDSEQDSPSSQSPGKGRTSKRGHPKRARGSKPTEEPAKSMRAGESKSAVESAEQTPAEEPGESSPKQDAGASDEPIKKGLDAAELVHVKRKMKIKCGRKARAGEEAVLGFYVLSSGATQGIRMRSQGHDAELSECMKKILGETRFTRSSSPRRTGQMRVSF